MNTWTVTIDPAGIAVDRTELDLNTGPIRVDQKGIDWGAADIDAAMAQQPRYGALPVDFTIPNRTVTIPLFLGADDQAGEEAARAALQAKVGLLQREGGILMRRRDDVGIAMYADIVKAAVTIPDRYGETGDIEPDVALVLTCLPDFYGDEVTLDALVSNNGTVTSVLQQGGTPAVIAGDYPARGRIMVTNTSGNAQNGLLWGVRSRHYDSASTARLRVPSATMTPLSGATQTNITAGTGGSAISYPAIQLMALPGGAWVPFVELTDTGGTLLTHVGTYRVWARMQSQSAGVDVRLTWAPGSLAAPIVNDTASIPIAGDLYLLDLGTVRLDRARAGVQQWTAIVQAYADTAGLIGTTIAITEVIFQPIDEAAGRLAADTTTPTLDRSYMQALSTGASATGSGVAWQALANANGADSQVAIVTAAGSYATTQTLLLQTYNFKVPATATVTGLGLSLRRYNGAIAADLGVQLVKAGVVQNVAGGNLADTATLWPAGWSERTYGGPTELWGNTWTAADINPTGFGVAFAAQVNGTGPVGIDYIQVTVYFTLASGFTVAQDVVVAANGGVCELRHDGTERQAVAGGAYGPVQPVGDLVRLPPSGIETRPVELLIRQTRSDFAQVGDRGTDPVSVTVSYRPCWLGRP